MTKTATRIALLSDIHGNDLALEAVLTDIDAAGGVDAYWVLGDLVAIGPAPVRVMKRLAGLTENTRVPIQFIRGNTDRWVATGEHGGPSLAEVRANPDRLEMWTEIATNFAWTRGALTATGWMDWLSRLPVEYRTTLPDGSRVLCVHASPGHDDGKGFTSKDDPAEVEARLTGCEADLLCVGHTHQPFLMKTTSRQVLNPGSLSNPFGYDVRASYALLTADGRGFSVEHRRVEYDTEAVIAEAQRIAHPAAGILARYLRGAM